MLLLLWASSLWSGVSFSGRRSGVVSLADVSVLIIIFTAGVLWVPLQKLQAQSQAFALSLPLLSLEVTLLGSELELSESGFTSCHLFSTKE